MQGEWQDDRQHGQGEARYPDGSTYSGAWQAGAWHGPGSQRLADGSTYVGEFQNGLRHGKGNILQGFTLIYRLSLVFVQSTSLVGVLQAAAQMAWRSLVLATCRPERGCRW